MAAEALEARAEEVSALEAIYGADFEVVSDAEWRITLADCGGALLAVLPEGYPGDGPPLPILELSRLGKGGADGLADELRELWQPGEGCVIQWVEHVRERLQAEEGGPGEAAAEEAAAPLSRGIPLEPDVARQLAASLAAAGFLDCSGGVFSHGDRGVTVEACDELAITVDGIDAEDLLDWAAVQLSADAAHFGQGLLDWTKAQRDGEGFLDDGEAAAGEDNGLDYLPSPDSLGVRADRTLHIYTWGKALRKGPPPDSQFNFNAGVLNGRGGGADLRTMNGLSDEVQSNVASCGLFPRWIEMVCNKIEGADLHTVSINCTKGRHRSVAAAEILRRVYYPSATMKHLTIY